MTVGVNPGKGTVPIWAAITVIVSILLAVGGIAVGAVSKASDGEHRVMLSAITDQKVGATDREVRLRAVEAQLSVLQAHYQSLIDGQDRIIKTLDAMRSVR